MAEIDLIFNLQNVCDTIVRLSNARSAIIDSLVSKKESIIKLDSQIRKAEEQKKQIKLKLDKVELEIATLDSKVKKEEGKLNIVRNPKEYDGLMNNIKVVRDKIDGLETIELELIEESEQNEGQHAELLEKRTAEFNSLKNYSDRAKEEITRIENELRTLEEERADLREKILRFNLAHFDTLMDKNGCALAIVDIEGICSNCSMNIVANKIRAISNNSGQIVKCSNCERYLYWTGPVDE